MALLADGTVIVWGNDTYGQVTDASLVSNVVYVESGTSTCFAVHGDGSVTRWGLTSGAGAIPALSNVVKIAAGLTHALALLRDGTVVGWGSNTNGMATPPEGLTDVVEIAASQYHSMARKSDGSVVCWGQNTFGECDVPLEYQPT